MGGQFDSRKVALSECLAVHHIAAYTLYFLPHDLRCALRISRHVGPLSVIRT